MPLTMANIGETNTIKRVSVIVNIKDSRVAVNADMARHIMI